MSYIIINHTMRQIERAKRGEISWNSLKQTSGERWFCLIFGTFFLTLFVLSIVKQIICAN